MSLSQYFITFSSHSENKSGHEVKSMAGANLLFNSLTQCFHHIGGAKEMRHGCHLRQRLQVAMLWRTKQGIANDSGRGSSREW